MQGEIFRGQNKNWGSGLKTNPSLHRFEILLILSESRETFNTVRRDKSMLTLSFLYTLRYFPMRSSKVSKMVAIFDCQLNE